MYRKTSVSALVFVAVSALPAVAQEQLAASETPSSNEPNTEQASTDNLLSDPQLVELMAPVALYPDTLLMQILVAATYPLQIVKADQAVDRVADLAEEDRKAAIEAESFDPSVEVLAVAFPDVLQRMADNIDWTETVGDAMLAQSDDVLETVQVLRREAVETGALTDTPEQEVSVESSVSSSGDPAETVVVQPTDPEVVYVPQYDSNVVYDTSSYGVGDALLTGALIFGTVALIDEIFDDDDDWYGYWGCRNCGGWNGQPIIRNPDIDFDIDGNVNIGNEINIDRDNIKNEIGDRPGGWQPDPGRQEEAREKLANRGEAGARPIPTPKDSRGDDLRQQLSGKAGIEDISRPGNEGGIRDAAVAAGAVGGAMAGREALKRTDASKDIPVNRPSKAQAPAKRPDTRKSAQKTAAKKTAAKPNAKRSASSGRKPALKKSSGGHKTKAASKRGRASHKKARR
ncbi:DUF3300 domain-containing protein [Ruegeria hyattellae]|uniref:DUF3300 domain-containing protein n=1 Tax=Ruegeria hyattellae TaxID=3233337 RepID=UPI00355C6ACD